MPERPEFDRIIYSNAWKGFIALHPTIKHEHQIHDWLDFLRDLMIRTIGKDFIVFAEVGVNKYTKKNAAVHFHLMTLKSLVEAEDAKIETAVRRKMKRMCDPSANRVCAYGYSEVRSLDAVRDYATKEKKNGRPSLKLPQRITWRQTRKKSYRQRGLNKDEKFELQKDTRKTNCPEPNVYVAVDQPENADSTPTALSKQGAQKDFYSPLECGKESICPISKKTHQGNQRQIKKKCRSETKKTTATKSAKTQSGGVIAGEYECSDFLDFRTESGTQFTDEMEAFRQGISVEKLLSRKSAEPNPKATHDFLWVLENDIKRIYGERFIEAVHLEPLRELHEKLVAGCKAAPQIRAVLVDAMSLVLKYSC